MVILGLEQTKIMQRVPITRFLGQYLPVKNFSLNAIAMLMSGDRAAEQITGENGHGDISWILPVRGFAGAMKATRLVPEFNSCM